ncbi:MAG: STAS domain-containing protein [Phycisphaeraceae bacterium]
MSLTAESVEEDGVALLNCGDDMNALAMCEEFTELKDLVGEDWASQSVGLGFAEASYIDSAAIGWLLSLHKTMDEAGGKLVLHSMSPSVRRVLTMMRLESVLNIADDKSAAVKELKKKKKRGSK